MRHGRNVLLITVAPAPGKQDVMLSAGPRINQPQ
jgi:hypothetical protein